ncbi:hypothetical protein [Modestobacter sp. VKM Ac-2984]|nr:hypothetical protein [Modestobacter sp. VKM Ac-2984]MCZ2815958.1 hypothetical protein [Modestobacter sp. VKM Ac-2984]
MDDNTGLVVHVLIDEDRFVPTRLEAYGDGDEPAEFPRAEALRLMPADSA